MVCSARKELVARGRERRAAMRARRTFVFLAKRNELHPAGQFVSSRCENSSDEARSGMDRGWKRVAGFLRRMGCSAVAG